MIEFFVTSEVILSGIAVIILIVFETPLSRIVDKAIYKLKVKQQDKLFHRYCERCQDYNCIDYRKMTTCHSCKYSECYPEQKNNYFRERVR